MGKRETGIGHEYRSAIGRLATQHRLIVLRGAAAVLLASAVAALAVVYLLHGLFSGWPPLPLLSFFLFWAVIAAAVYAVARRQLSILRSWAGVAEDIDRVMGLRGLLISSFEFSGSNWRLERYSPYLRDETVRRALEEIRSVEPGSLFASAGRPAWTAAGLLAAILLLAQVSFMAGLERSVLASVTDPGIYFRCRGSGNLLVTSGDLAVMSGGSVTCEAVDFGSRSGEVSLIVSSVQGVWRETGLSIDTSRTDGADMALYRRRFENIRESFDYAFVSGAGRSDVREVTVIHRPVINSLRARITPPPYTGSPVRDVPAIAGRIYAPSGSRLELIGETSKEISRGELWFSSGERLPLDPVPGGFEVSFAATRDDTFIVEVVDTMGLANERRIGYPITVLEDQGPGIEILAPEDGAQMPLSMLVELVYRATDDYGVSRLTLHAMRGGKDEGFRTAELPLPQGESRREIEGSESWELSGMRLLPGDEVLYFLEVCDNNAALGPSRGRSETRRIVVPSLADIYENIRDEERMRREGLDDALEESGKVRTRLRELSDELKASGELDWSRRKESRELLAKQEELTEKIGQAADLLDSTLETLARNSATTQEIGERLAEIRELIEQIESDELREALESFRKALDDVDSGEFAEAMRRVDVNLEEFARRLERAAELLKQVMREEKLEEFVRRAEEMIEKQGELEDSEADTEELADRQETLASEMETFERDMEALAAEEAGSQFSEGIEEILGEMERGEIGRSMMEAASKLAGGDRSAAQGSQGDAMDGLLSLYTSLSRLQFGIGIAMDAEAMGEIARSARRLVEISKEQERWIFDVALFGGAGPLAEHIERQIILKEAIASVRERLYLVARKTMAVPGAVFYQIERAMAATDGVLEAAGERRGPDAADRARGAYESLNLAAIELLRSGGASGSCGGEGDSAGMQRIMGEQFSLDRQLREMLGGGSAGQWSMEERAGMARLAAEQRRLEELLQQTLEESRGAGELLGRLDDLGDDMLEVAERLERGELDDGLLEREERILSRMLDSQRSLARRDYKRERISRAAGDVAAAPGSRAAAHGSDAELLLEMIRRSMRERGPAEYEELNRFYFRALSRKVRAAER